MELWTILLDGEEWYTVSSVHSIAQRIKELQGCGLVEVIPAPPADISELINALVQC